MRKASCLTALAALAAFSCARGEVKMPPLFGDHMLLQQDIKLPVYGTAAPGEKVTVAIKDRTATTTAGTDGKWIVRLEPLPVTREGVQLTVNGTNRLVFNDVLVGDVWLASGQSNMEYSINYVFDSAPALKAADHPQLRLFIVSHRLAFAPVSDYTGKWIVCTPEDLRKSDFSAVAYFFAQEILADRQIPIGVIGCYWGASSLQAWTSAEALRMDPSLKGQLDKFENIATSLPELKAKYEKEILPAFQARHDAWSAEVNPAYENALAQWDVENKKASAEKRTPPPRPTPSKPEPTRPRFEGDSNQLATVLYNGMIAPLVPYGFKGALWYQGESNIGASKEYTVMFPLMVADWRGRWGLGDFPFLFVQLPGWGGGNESLPPLRDAQRKTLSVPRTAMAVTLDIGDAQDLHPHNKKDVGHRLALAARQLVYGENVVGSGPMLDRIQKEGSKMRVFFTSVGGGLVIQSDPTGRADVPPPPPADHLEGFEIAGMDGKFVPARAVIDGATVVVSADAVPDPVAVQYGWKPFPTVNLYNKEGLPAVPFQVK